MRWESAGSGCAAESSNVRSAATTGPEELTLSPPASDMSVMFVPFGAESITSMSSTQWRPPKSGLVVTSTSVTLTSVIVPVSPLTTSGAG